MKKELIFHGRTIYVVLSDSARQAAEKLSINLLIEIQIYFSCMLGKRLAFYSSQPLPGACLVDAKRFSEMLAESQPLTDKLALRFNTVMTKSCPVSDYDGPPPVTDFHIANKKPYVPDWLNIDFRSGIWYGEYGWACSDRTQSNTKQINSYARKTGL